MVISLLFNNIQYRAQLARINLQLQKTQKPFRLPYEGKEWYILTVLKYEIAFT